MKGETTQKPLCVKPGCEAPIASRNLMICRDHISKMGLARRSKAGRAAAERFKEEGYRGQRLCEVGICFEAASEGEAKCPRHLGQPLKLDTPQEIAQALRRLAEAVEGLGQ